MKLAPVFAGALAVLLLPAAAYQASAQQSAPWPPDEPDNAQGQQAPDPQSGYGQQAYPQKPSPYAYPQNGQQGYPQQPQAYPPPQGYPQQPQASPQQQGYPDQQDYADPSYSQQQAYDYNQPQQPGYGAQQPITPQQPLAAQDLEQLVAPIALYPDSLLAQILAASTYPAQVAAADQWLRSQGFTSADQVAAAASAQTSWDPSVKALTAFPQVLQMLDGNLQWTTQLGNAYYNQPQDVLQSVQVMRQRAEQSGNLQSTPQEQVIQNQGYIALAPTDPEVVYVPAYNPWAVYGQPIAPYPGFSFFGALGSFFGAGLHYGLGFGVSAFEHTPFGLLAWGLDWLANSILFHHEGYWSHSRSVRDWGLPHGGPRAFGRGGMERAGWGGGYHHEAIPIHGGQGFNRGAEGFNRSGNSAYGREQGFQNRTQEGFNRGGYQDRGYGGGYTHPALPQQGFNRGPQTMGRTQGYDNRQQAYAARPQGYDNRAQQFGAPSARSGYASVGAPHALQNYSGTRGMGYSQPSQAYRAPTPSFSHGYSDRPSSGFGDTYRQQQARVGGYSSFGSRGGESYAGRAPKSYGGNSFKGHGGGGFKAPKASHSGGGHASHGHSGGGHHH